jgi:thiamine biosynthesis lipoprotein
VEVVDLRCLKTALFFVFALLICCVAPTYAQNRYEYSEVAMGVRARIVLYATDKDSAQTAVRAAYDRIAELEDIMSDYRPDSELMRLCKKAGDGPVEVSGDLYFMLCKCEELSRRSDGAFDCTAGPVIKLWRSARKSGKLPNDFDLEAARKLVGWRKLKLLTPCGEQAGTVKLTVPGMQLDLGGIAKGYACDEAIRILKEHGISSALVEMGGDIVVSAPPPGKKGWGIQITNSSAPRTITLSHAAISSSGDTNQFVEIGGKRYSHIVDPRTGIGLTNRMAVTIIAPNGVTSDGLSTAISVLGPIRGKTLANAWPGVSICVLEGVGG